MSHSKIIREMQESDQVVHVIRSRTATELIADRLVRYVTVQPAPPKGQTAVSLTALGKAAPTDALVVEVETDTNQEG